jgi:hypothetical protein
MLRMGSKETGRLTAVLEPSTTSKTPVLETDYAYTTLNGSSTATTQVSINQVGLPGVETPVARSFMYDGSFVDRSLGVSWTRSFVDRRDAHFVGTDGY